MATETPALSSSNLFNFTKKIDILKLILQNGFLHKKWTETLPLSNVSQENYIVCFCDIPWNQNQEHRDCYGNNGMVMTKEWGIKNGISPVRYINGTSAGMSESYLQRKCFHRELLQNNQYDFASILPMELVNEKYIHNGALHEKHSLYQEFKNNSKFAQTFQTDLDNFAKMEKAIVSAGFQVFYEQIKGCTCSLIETLYDELEHRDAFERNYKEDFYHENSGTHPDKILYDEREWRSVKYLGIDALKTTSAPDVLPTSDNLKFNDDDVVAILVEKEECKNEIQELIRSGKTLLSAQCVDKVFFINEYKE